MLTELLLNGYSAQRINQNSSLKPIQPNSESSEDPKIMADRIGFAQEDYSVELSKEAQNQEKPSSEETKKESDNPKELDEDEKQEVEKLKKRDREVHIHEQAHLSAAGPYAKGGAKFEYETGPDNKRYAVGGHVNIDTSKEKTPEATIQKARTVYRAALAPAQPSGADRQVASSAKRMELEAQKEIQQEKAKEAESSTTSTAEKPDSNSETSPATEAQKEDSSKSPTISDSVIQAYKPSATSNSTGSTLDIAA